MSIGMIIDLWWCCIPANLLPISFPYTMDDSAIGCNDFANCTCCGLNCRDIHIISFDHIAPVIVSHTASNTPCVWNLPWPSSCPIATCIWTIQVRSSYVSCCNGGLILTRCIHHSIYDRRCVIIWYEPVAQFGCCCFSLEASLDNCLILDAWAF